MDIHHPRVGWFIDKVGDASLSFPLFLFPLV